MEVAAILAIILLDYPDFCLIIALLVMNATISYREEASADKVLLPPDHPACFGEKQIASQALAIIC